MQKIRNANKEDIKDITKIYNEAVKNSIATFDTEEKTVKQMNKWFNDHSLKNPVIVVELNNKIIAWASLSKYDTKKAYSDTSELSLYVKKDFQGRGIGKKLIKTILDKGKIAGLHAIISRVTDGNSASIYLHEKFGFKKIGTLKEVGKKFGKILDVHIYEKLLK